MGQITIKTEGSFTTTGTIIESAEEGGHAAAIGRAVQYLLILLPAAIELDHRLHDKGDHPPKSPFGRPQIVSISPG